MQTIGERLEDARKRKGISIREAAEATKIRGDYLQKFESNQFDVGLAEIYIRGFLHNYAAYLHLPADRVLKDYAALGRGEARPRQPNREVYGRMDVSVSSALGERAESPSPAPSEAPALGEAPRPAHRVSLAGNRPSAPKMNPALVYKSAVWGAIVLGVLLLLWIAKALFGGSSTPAPAPAPVATTPAAAQQPDADSTVTVMASGPVHIRVTRQSDRAELFDGDLAKGESHDFPNVPFSLNANALESVHFEFKGKQFNVTTKGEGSVSVDANKFPASQ